MYMYLYLYLCVYIFIYIIICMYLWETGTSLCHNAGTDQCKAGQWDAGTQTSGVPGQHYHSILFLHVQAELDYQS